MFLSETVLWKDTWPVLPMGIDMNASRRWLTTYGSSYADGRHRRGTLIDDAGIFRVEGNPQFVDLPRLLGQAAVAEVETEQVGVGDGIQRRSAAKRTIRRPRGSFLLIPGPPFLRPPPVADRRPRNLQLPRHSA